MGLRTGITLKAAKVASEMCKARGRGTGDELFTSLGEVVEAMADEIVCLSREVEEAKAMASKSKSYLELM